MQPGEVHHAKEHDMKIAIWAITLGVLAACQPISGVPGSSGSDSCGASGYQGLVGASLAAITLPNLPNARYIGPDTMVTMDYSPTRINFHFSKDRVITRIDCG